MKKIAIYDPAMCCSTGLCGPSVNPELLRVAATIEALKKQGADITRYNLSSEPQEFVLNTAISELLKADANVLPVTIVGDEVVKTKHHLTNQEFETYTGLTVGSAPSVRPDKSSPCCK